MLLPAVVVLDDVERGPLLHLDAFVSVCQNHVLAHQVVVAGVRSVVLPLKKFVNIWDTTIALALVPLYVYMMPYNKLRSVVAASLYTMGRKT